MAGVGDAGDYNRELISDCFATGTESEFYPGFIAYRFKAKSFRYIGNDCTNLRAYR
jgi:hypothetical protein